MNEKIVRRIHDVLGAGLEILERLDRQENPRMEIEHGRLVSLLLAGGELEYDPIYNGELATTSGRETSSQDINNRFFGVRYPLACWLDELFLSESAPGWWRDQWLGDTMEVRLYGGAQQRAWRFWDQARKAEGPRGSPEALEAYLWCVMLGFRGEPKALKPEVNPPHWVENVRKRVLAARSTDFPVPQQREAPTMVPALRGPDRLATMFRVAFLLGGAAAFALAFTLIYKL